MTNPLYARALDRALPARRAPASASAGAASAQEWLAQLELEFALGPQGRTLLARRAHVGPLVVQRPFYPESGGTCHVYLVHPPGGLVAGDRLEVKVHARSGAQALLTTPSAGKLYRSRADHALATPPLATQRNVLHVHAGAQLEWLPQENIAFAGARASLGTRVELAEDAVFAGWDILCLGRPAAGERFDHGEVAQRFELWRNQQPLLIERLQFAGGDSVLDEPWGLGGASVTGTFLATSVPPGGAAILQNQWPESAAGDLVSATQFEDVVACRYLGGSAERARKYFTSAWSVLRPLATSRQAVSPRVWAT